MRPAAAQWQAVGYGSDPVPGDPDVVAQGGSDYLAVADAIVGAKRRLEAIDLDGQISRAVDELLEKTGDVASDIGKAEARYRAAGQALTAYAPALRTAQDDSATALYRASSALQASDSANSNRQYYLTLAQSETDPASQLQYTNLAKQSGDDADDATASVAAWRSQIDAAAATRDAAAERAISHIQEITSHDGLKDSWWDNWGKDLLEKITDIAGIVASIAGVLALCVAWIPVVGQVLAAALLVVTAVAAVINAIGNTVLAITGDRTWGQAIVSIIGAALCCLGIGGALRVLAQAGKEGVVVANSSAVLRSTNVLEKVMTPSRAEKIATQINRIASRQTLADGETMDTVTAQHIMELDPTVLDESMRAWATPVDELENGQLLSRVYGGGPNGSTEFGKSYSSRMPDEYHDPAETLGLPKESVPDTLVRVRVVDASRADITRHALPYEGRIGGAPEYKFPGGEITPDVKGLEKLDTVKLSLP
ncbi:hypothetical protein [Gryllotalpicola protaetiae]|uniref:Uncharacterized protein n=1 Tax=Gryllotalpicola protaetiae TaxID=2419771 RepID=A0A387BPP2_9MICO|nr:hypothetical protein [Gryllotalpicola protaetiae]AYG03079.1 hypothetical protein D7I44_05745 [Gryllotalpicola protaetiae]